MSLINQDNPAFWNDGTPRSMHSGFSMGLSGDWSDVIELSKARARSAAAAERQRLAGKDRSTIYGLSRKEKSRKRLAPVVKAPGAGCHPNSNAGKLRALLAEKGPLTHMQLATESGLAYKSIGGYLANDIDKGRVVKVRALGEVIRYSLVEAQ